MKRQVAFTLRFDPELYRRIKSLCSREGRSVTAFVQEAVVEKVAEEDAAALFDAFTLVGDEGKEANVEFGHTAQSEVAFRDE